MERRDFPQSLLIHHFLADFVVCFAHFCYALYLVDYLKNNRLIKLSAQYIQLQFFSMAITAFQIINIVLMSITELILYIGSKNSFICRINLIQNFFHRICKIAKERKPHHLTINFIFMPYFYSKYFCKICFRPSSLLLKVTSSAIFFTSSGTFPIATPKPAYFNLSISLKLSPMAMIS